MRPRTLGFLVLGCLCLLIFVQPGLFWTHYHESPAKVVAYPVDSPNETRSPIAYENLSSRAQVIFDEARTADGPTVVYGPGFRHSTFAPFLLNEYVLYQNTTYYVDFDPSTPKEAVWATEPLESILRYLIGGLGVLLVGIGSKRVLT